MCPPSREITNEVSPDKKFKVFYPSLLVKSPDVIETCFNWLLENMVSSKQLPKSSAKEAKQEFPKFLWMVIERREDFIEFDVTAESYCLDIFYSKFMEGTSSKRGFKNYNNTFTWPGISGKGL